MTELGPSRTVMDPLPHGGRIAVYEPYRVTQAQLEWTLRLSGVVSALPGAFNLSKDLVLLVSRSREMQASLKGHIDVVLEDEGGGVSGSQEAALHGRLRALGVERLLVRSFDSHGIDWFAFAALDPPMPVYFLAKAKAGGVVQLQADRPGEAFFCEVQNQARLAIVTFVEAANFGAALQAYALQTVMQRQGLNAELVDYSCPHFAWAYAAMKRTGLYARDWREFVVKIWRLYLDTMRNRRFRRFKRNNLKQTRRFFTLADLLPLNDAYAGFIAGSDQVFSIRCSNLDTAYFLSFVTDDAKKFTYAASFGFSEIPRPFEPLFRTLLGSFSRFSMREPSGREIIRSLLGRESEVHVDPTLLLGAQDWAMVASMDRRRKPRRYVLVYNVNPPIALFRQAVELAKARGCAIVYLGFDFFWIHKALRRDVHVVYSIGPEEFVSYMAGAECVLTNSFHGTVFSVLFHKPFLVELENGSLFNHRAKALLDMLGLSSRVLDGSAADVIGSPVDWGKCDEILDSERARAFTYLKSLI